MYARIVTRSTETYFDVTVKHPNQQERRGQCDESCSQVEQSLPGTSESGGELTSAIIEIS